MRRVDERDQHVTALRSRLFLSEALGALISDVYALKREALLLAVEGLSVPIYWVRRPWRTRLILGPFNIVADYGDRTADVVERAVGRAKEAGASAQLRTSHPVPEALANRLQLQHASGNVETVLDLSGGWSALSARMRPRHRSKIRKVTAEAGSLGIGVRRFEDRETLLRFYRLLSRTYGKQHKMLPQPWSLLDGLFALPECQRAFGYVAEDRTGKLVAGIIILPDREQWIYAWGASERASGLELGTLLLQRAIEDAMAAGAKWFSLGATPLSHESLLQYKRGWGGKEMALYDYAFGEPPPQRDFHAGFPLLKKIVGITPPRILSAVSPYAVRLLI